MYLKNQYHAWFQLYILSLNMFILMLWIKKVLVRKQFPMLDHFDLCLLMRFLHAPYILVKETKSACLL